MRYTAVIPTLNPGEALPGLLDALRRQTVPPDEIVMADSESDDGTAEMLREEPGIRLVPVKRDEFAHGWTRDAVLRSCKTPFVVMMTQDALPADEKCMEELLRPFMDPQVAAVCARQIARPEAKSAEKAVRAFRYPDETDVWGKEDIPRRGIRSCLLSDVCAAYRVSAYEAVGGFTYPISTNEDMLIAADFLDAGYKLAYQGNAKVWHSHDYTLRQEYERNRKIGQFLAKYGDRFGGGDITGEGLSLVRFVFARLVREGKITEVLPFCFNCAARLLGNRRGRRQRG